MEILDIFAQALTKGKKAVSKLTLKNYLSDLRHFANWFQTLTDKKLEPTDITEDLIDLYKSVNGAAIKDGVIIGSPISPRSFARYLSSLRKLTTILKEQNLIPSNPFIAIQESEISDQPSDLWHFQDFKDFLYRGGSSHLTIKNYINDIHNFSKWYETAVLPNLAEPLTSKKNGYYINQEILEEYKKRLIDVQGAAPRTINRKLSTLRKYLEFLTKQEILEPEDIIMSSVELESAVTQPSVSLQDLKSTTVEADVKLKYSPFPPLRLLQKILILPYLLLEEKIALGIAAALIGSKLVSTLPLSFRQKSKISSQAGQFKKTLRLYELLGIRNVKKEFYAPQALNISTYPLHKKIIHHIRFTRPDWYKRYTSYTFTHYLHFALLVIFAAGVGIALYQNFVANKNLKPTFASPVAPSRVLSFQGRLTDNLDNPITSTTNLRFAIYNDVSASGAALLWQEVQYAVVPDQDGIFSVILGTNTTIPSTVFSDNASTWLGVTVEATSELTPRQRIASVAYATNSEQLQGMPPISGSLNSNVILALDSSGNLTIGGSANPSFTASGGQFKLSGQPLLLTTNASSNSNIFLVPDGLGKIDLQKPLVNSTNTGNITPGGVEINDKFGVLATESAVAAFIVNNNTTGGDIFAASSSGTTRFKIANDGTITDAVYNTNGGIFYANGSGTFAQTSAGSLGQCLQSIGGGTPTWGSCSAGSGTSPFTELNGAIVPINTTEDFFIGGTSTASADFAVLNVNGTGPATTSVSGNLIFYPKDGTGGVGLGTSTPVTYLDIEPPSGRGVAIGTNSYPTWMGTAGLYVQGTTYSINGYIVGSNKSVAWGTSSTLVTGVGGSSSSDYLAYTTNFIERFRINGSGNLGLGTTTPTSQLYVTRPLSSGANGKALAVFDQIENQDILTASAAGTPIFTITRAGGLALGANGLTVGTSSQCLIGGTTASWGSCSTGIGSGDTFWNQTNGLLYPNNSTVDFAIGGQSTSSAKFAILNVNGTGPATATISGNLIVMPNNGAGGALGIGTTTPSQMLNIANTTNAGILLQGDTDNDGGETGTGFIQFSQDAGNVKAILGTIQAAGVDSLGSAYTSVLNNATLLGTQNAFSLQLGTNNIARVTLLDTGNIGIGTNAPINALHVTRPLSFGATGKALAIFDQIENQDILTASFGGTTKFTISNTGALTDAAYTNAGGILYTSTTGLIGQTAAGSATDCLVGGTTPSFSSCASAAASSIFWNQANGLLFPKNSTVDVTLGGQSTASAKFGFLNINSNTPVASISANSGNNATYLTGDGILATANKQTLTVGSASTGEIRVGTDATARTVTIGNNTGISALNLTSGTGAQTFTSSNATGVTTASDFVFNANSINSGTGAYINSSSITTGKLLDLATTGNTLTTGRLFNLSSTATSLTGTVGIGSLANLDWSPGSATTATGDLFALNIGTNGTTTGNLFNILDTGSSLFSVSETGVTSNLPTTFNSPGDVSMAYDLVFTNPTSSNIVSAAPLSIYAGETFNSSNLTLGTYNVGNVVVDSQAFLTNYAATISGQLVSGTSTAPSSIGAFYLTNSATFGKALAILNQTESQDILTGSASGTTKFAFDNSGNLKLATGTTLDTLASGTLGIGTTNATTLTLGRTSQTISLPGYNSAGGVFYSNSGSLAMTAAGTATDCLVGGATPSFTSCAGAAASSIFWAQANGTLYPKNSTVDVFVGGQSTSSAKFAILNVNGTGPVTATVSGNLIVMPTNGAGGYVGIGTTAPAAQLDVKGPSTGHVLVGALSNSTGFGGISFLSGLSSPTYALAGDSSGYTILNASSGQYLSLRIANSEKVRVDLNGNLGVGTTTPTALLDVAGTASIAGALKLYTTPTIQSTANQTLTLGGDTTGAISLMPSNGTGFVGVDTANPVTNLHVVNTSAGAITYPQILNNFSTTTNTGVALRLANTSSPGTTNNLNGIVDLISQRQADGSSDFSIQTSPGSSGAMATRLYIDGSSGNVGLGSSVPTSQLYVTHPLAYGANGQALAIFDQIENQDILTGSAAGTTKFKVDRSGNTVASGFYRANNGLASQIDLGLDLGGSVYSGLSFSTDTNLYRSAANTLKTDDAFAVGTLNSGASSVLCYDGSNILSSCIGGIGTNYWQLNSGALSPFSSKADVLIGSTATTSAKFAFINVAGNTPTASISASSGNIATYLTGDGTLATTNRQTLTIGNSSTYNTTGVVLINPNGTGNVGIGTSNPAAKLEVAGNILVGNNGTVLANGSGTITLGNTNGGTVFIQGDGGTSQVYSNSNHLELGTYRTSAADDNIIFTGTRDTGTNQWMTILGGSGYVGIGTSATSPSFQLQITGGNQAGKAALAVNQIGNSANDIFTASASGTPKFTIGNTGAITDAAYTGQNGVLYGTQTTGVIAQASTATPNLCLLSGASNPSWGTCTGGGSGGYLRINLGALSPVNDTLDFLIGSASTASAKFGFLNVNSGTPIASISANNGNIASYHTGDGTIATTNRQTLTIGNSSTYNTTGTVLINPNGTGRVGIGTTNPEYGFDVGGSTGLVGRFGSAGAIGDQTYIAVNGTRSYFGYNGSTLNAVVQGIAGKGIEFDVNNNTFGAGTAMTINTSANVGIGTTSQIAELHVTRPLSAGVNGKALAIFDQIENQDILTGSAAGTTKFAFSNAGALSLAGGQTSDIDTLTATTLKIGATNATTITLGRTSQTISLPGYNSAGGVFYSNSGALAMTGAGSSSQCLLGGATPTFGSCATGITGDAYWNQTNGVLYPNNATVDLALGSTSTASARFSVKNINTGVVIASASANIGGNIATYLTGDGTIATTNRQTLTIGNSSTYNTTGVVLINPNGTGNVGIGVTNPIAKLHVGGTIAVAYGSGLEALANSGAYGAGTSGFYPDTNIIGLNDTSIKYGSGNNNFVLQHGTTSVLTADQYGNIGIGTTAPLSSLHINGINSAGRAALIVDQTASSSNDIFTASASGVTKFTISNTGAITDAAYTGQNGVLYGTQTTGVFAQATTATTNFCLLSGASSPTWGSCAAAVGTGLLRLSNGAISPINDTTDFLIGAISTASAKFGFLNVNSGTPIASISANSGNIATYLTGNGTLATTNRQPLTIGNSSTYNTTGDILIDPNGTGNVAIGAVAPLPSLKLDVNVGAAAYLAFNGNHVGIGDVNAGWGMRLTSGLVATYGTGLTLKAGGDNTSNQVISFFTSSTTLGTTEKVRIDQNGNLGVGTASPIAALHITRPLSFAVTGKALAVFDQIENQDILTASSGGTPKFVITNAGNVGIGITIPTELLHINTGTGTTQAIARLSAASDQTLSLRSPNNSGNAEVISSYNLKLSSAYTGGTASLANIILTPGTVGNIGIGTTLPKGFVHISGGAYSGNAALVVDQLGSSSNDIFTASASGTTKFSITNAGGIKLGTSEGSSTNCLISGGAGAAASWGTCGTGSASPFGITSNGLIYAGNATADFVLGSAGIPATTSARFKVIGINSGVVVASASANIGSNNATYFSGDGILGTTNRQTLTLGSASSGQLILKSSGTTVFHNTGTANIFVGESAGGALTNGAHNSFFGYQAGFSNTTGGFNLFMGDSAGYANIGGANNAFIGVSAGVANTSGSHNLFIGNSAGGSNLSGNSNTFLGESSGFSNTTGTNNVFIGSLAGDTANGANANLAGSNNTFIGYQSGPEVDTQLYNATAIGYQATVRKNNSLILGGTGVNGVNVAIGTSSATTTFQINQIVAADNLFAASVSGVTKFIIDNTGKASALSTNGISVGAIGKQVNVFTSGTGVDIGWTASYDLNLGFSLSAGDDTIVGGGGFGSRLAVGTTAPAASLDIQGGNWGGNAVAIFNQLGAATNDLITASASGVTKFKVSNGGKVTASGGFNGQCLSALTFNTSGGNSCNMDVAEIYPASEPVASGDLVEIDPSNSALVKKGSQSYSETLLGVVSTEPGLILGVNNGEVILGGASSTYQQTADPLRPAVALNGRVPVKVTLENGPIHKGDPITSSSTSGNGMKATKAGKIVGYALDDYNGTTTDNQGKIMVFINPNYYYGNAIALDGSQNSHMLDTDGNIVATLNGKIITANNVQKLVKENFTKELGAFDENATATLPIIQNLNNGVYALTNSIGNTINRTASFSKVIAANISAGSINASSTVTNSLSSVTGTIGSLTTSSLNVTADAVSVGGKSLTAYVTDIVHQVVNGQQSFVNGQTIISPLASIDQIHTNIISPLGNHEVAIKGNLAIKNDANETVASIDTQGNATFSGSLTADNATINDATIAGTLAANNVTTNDASVAGTLRANNIIANNIDGLDDKIRTIASGSSNLNNYTASSITTGNLRADYGLFEQGIVALGPSTFGSITATENVNVGGTLTLGSDSINTIGGDLEIQPLKQGGVSFLAGLVKIDTDGNMNIGGNLSVAGNFAATKGVFTGLLTADSIATNIISPIPNKDLVLKLSGESFASTSGRLQVQDKNGTSVLAVNSKGDLQASGSAQFAKLNFNLVGQALATSDLTATATGSAGYATLKANRPELTIKNPNVTENSLIYITPFGDTQGKVLYLLRQTPQDPANGQEGSFTVGVSGPQTTTDLQFNWLIVN